MGGKRQKKHKRKPSGNSSSNTVERPRTGETESNPDPHDNEPSVMGKWIQKPPEPMFAIWGVVIAAFVAVIYFFQLVYLAKSVNLSSDNFRTDERAWVGAKGFAHHIGT